MVMDRGHAEDALACAFIPENLKDDRQGFHHEQAAADAVAALFERRFDEDS